MGRPKQPLIDRKRVVEAALDIIDTEGLARLSVRRLGEAMNVNAASFYYHFKSKDAILIEVAKSILANNRPRETSPDLDWREMVLEYSHRYRAALEAHPNIVPFMESHPHRAFATGFWDFYARMLLDSGVPASDVMPLLDAAEALVLGHVHAYSEERTQFPPDLNPYPYLAKAVEADTLPPAERFERGMRAMLEGWRTTKEAVPKRKSRPSRSATAKVRS